VIGHLTSVPSDAVVLQDVIEDLIVFAHSWIINCLY